MALDTCSNSMRIGHDLYGLLKNSQLCNSEFGITNIELDSVGAVLVVGEDNTMATSRILEPLKLAYLSPNAMSTLLDDRSFLARTITPASGRMRLLSSFLNKIG